MFVLLKDSTQLNLLYTFLEKPAVPKNTENKENESSSKPAEEGKSKAELRKERREQQEAQRAAKEKALKEKSVAKAAGPASGMQLFSNKHIS